MKKDFLSNYGKFFLHKNSPVLTLIYPSIINSYQWIDRGSLWLF